MSTGAPTPDAHAPGTYDGPRAEAAVREFLLAIGEDPDREGLRDTPARVARASLELFAGLHQDPAGRELTGRGNVNDFDPIRLGLTGTYTLILQGQTNGAASATFRLLDLGAAPTVVPGTSVTSARASPASALNSDDFPAFGGPASTTIAPSRTIAPAGTVASSASIPASACAAASSTRSRATGPSSSSGKSMS